MKYNTWVAQKAKHSIPYDPAIPLLGIYPSELKTYVQLHECSQQHYSNKPKVATAHRHKYVNNKAQRFTYSTKTHEKSFKIKKCTNSVKTLKVMICVGITSLMYDVLQICKTYKTSWMRCVCRKGV